MALKTPEEARQELTRSGVSISKWAMAKGLTPFVVYQVLSGRQKGVRGEAHRAAVLLGLKEGEVAPANSGRHAA